MQADARASRTQGVRHDVLGVLARECPDVDLTAAALIVTELVANVVRHAYTEKGSVEIEVSCEPEAAVLTVRDWGHGFGEPTRHGLGVGLQIVEVLAQHMRIHRRWPTEVRTVLPRAASG